MENPQETSAPSPLVLVVEDDKMLQKVIVRLLSKLGYRTESAMDGVEAVAAHANKSFDAILMDCQMPELDGFEATSAIRRAEAATGAHTPIIALTAMHDARQRCLDCGMDDYLLKPVSPHDLADSIRRASSGARPEALDSAPVSETQGA